MKTSKTLNCQSKGRFLCDASMSAEGSRYNQRGFIELEASTSDGLAALSQLKLPEVELLLKRLVR